MGKSDQALEVLEEIYELSEPESAPLAAFALSQVHWNRRNGPEARRWLNKISLGNVRDREILAKIKAHGEELESHDSK